MIWRKKTYFACIHINVLAQNTQGQKKIVLMEICDLEVEPHLKKAEWRCAMTVNGGQCVMTTGGPMMLKWHADNLDSLLMVRFSVSVVLTAVKLFQFSSRSNC